MLREIAVEDHNIVSQPVVKQAGHKGRKLYQRRMSLRLVGVRFGRLVRGSYQINLFEDTQEMMSLYQAMDRIKNRFGANAVMRGSGMHQPKIP